MTESRFVQNVETTSSNAISESGGEIVISALNDSLTYVNNEATVKWCNVESAQVWRSI